MVKKGFLTLLLLAIIDSLCYSSSDHLDDLDAFKFTHSKTSTSYCGLYSIYAAAKSIGVDLHLENLVREAGQSHVSSMNNLRVASQLQSYPSHIAYVYLELHL
jgi:hypothetical protein